MSIVTTIKCDGEKCGKLRLNDSNHWLQGFSLGDAVIVASEVPTGVVLADWTGRPISKDEVKHFCGEQCANKWVSKEIGKLKRIPCQSELT